jgi:hypothetical protein
MVLRNSFEDVGNNTALSRMNSLPQLNRITSGKLRFPRGSEFIREGARADTLPARRKPEQFSDSSENPELSISPQRFFESRALCRIHLNHNNDEAIPWKRFFTNHWAATKCRASPASPP